MTTLKSILKPPTIPTNDSATDSTSPASLPTNTTTSTQITYSSPYPQNPPPAPNKIRRKPLPTLDGTIPRLTHSESSANGQPRILNPNPNQKQKLDRNRRKKVGFVSPVASYIPDPPLYTSESEYGEEEGSEEGDDHRLSETGSNRFDDGHDQDIEAELSAPLTSRFAANPTISLDNILVPSQLAGTDAQASKERKWTSRASERIKAGNKMLVGAGNGIRSLKRGFGGRGREGG